MSTRKKMSKVEKAAKEANRVKSQQKRTQKTWGIGIAIISILLVAAMLLQSIRF